MLSIAASAYSAIFLLIICLSFFSKKRIDTYENKIYSRMLIVVIVLCISDFISGIMYMTNYDITSIVYTLLTKFIFLLYVFWDICMFSYILSISKNEKKVTNKKMDFICCLLLMVIAAILIMTPLSIEVREEIVYPYGLAMLIMLIITFLLIISVIIILIKNIKNILNKKFIPLFSFIIFGTIIFIIQNITGILLMTSCVAIITSIMYFTIENPDVKMIAQLNEAKAQAEKANNAKSEFLSSMSHEIRTPLNAIVGFSQALSEEDLSDEAKEEVRDIISASNTLLEIVNGILDISKIEANKLEIINKEYNFKDIFDELVALTKGRLGEKPLEFKYIYDESIPSVLYGDHVRVKQIILNLLTNSVKYTKEGSITFTVNSVKKDDVIRLIVSVEDTGIGIKEENIGKLFSKFERFDEKNTTIEGTGLGLAITKQLVELMNGKIVVQSVYGKGSKFTVALDQKIVHGKVIESKDNNEDVVEFDLTGKKVLIVDDNNLNLKVASRLIKNYKCDITTVTSGIECLDKINNKKVFDLILMDDMMPRMSGGETLIRLKKIEGFNIPVVALTANAVTGMKEKYLQQGFDDYLAKPIEKGELNRVLHKFLKED